jgi:hypothetical protein
MWCAVILIQLRGNRQAWKCICRGSKARCELERQRSDVSGLMMAGQAGKPQVIVMPIDEWARIMRHQQQRPNPLAM